ncbi:hypothetical protein [Xenorhabdus szentirmaii]|uniref:Uncharacterized protein n=1 Tax=Xenorhabdus szentirmaii TaxID=290112 RepID=A0AAW3YX78_9GAMM|nr:MULTISPECIES: hypothetical protein [Xenorhabdus]MBD2792137.1 hypothetical protein [Xenorhabdus sp. CUL]MBD2801976.1 hypothetical protein [Xenorhabdus sp. M]MBD2803230.1 hypothetical protein [Xenorhabdus sp. ZM]MBD2821895.1 hypothetical protein [Xenorhabdus sp. 42]MBD2825557.1 hypothetical protein [Xenorhabdus sp. 5]
MRGVAGRSVNHPGWAILLCTVCYRQGRVLFNNQLGVVRTIKRRDRMLGLNTLN